MTYIFTIFGRLAGINEYTAAQRKNAYVGAKMKKKEQERVEIQIRKYLGHLRITKPVNIHYSYIEPNRKRDKDNISGFAHKVIQDALVSCGVLRNDGWNEIADTSDSYYVDRDNPRIIVRIEEVE